MQTKHEDPWLHRLWRTMCAVAWLIVIVCLTGLLVHMGGVAYDCHQAELQAKTDAKRTFDFHCHTVSGMGARVMQDCARQRAVLERGALSEAWHCTVQHHVDDLMPWYAYCRDRPDMCAMMTMKALEVLALLLYWLPVVLAGIVLLYLWHNLSWIVGTFLRGVTTLPEKTLTTPGKTD